MNWRQLPSNVVTRNVPGRDLDNSTRWLFNTRICVLMINGLWCIIILYQEYTLDYTQEHIADCKYTKIPCPNKQYGCTKLLMQSQWEEHLERECRYAPVQCPWCSKKVHNKEVNLKVKHSTGMLLSRSMPLMHACVQVSISYHWKSLSTESHQAGVWSCSSVLQ